jgi:tRNA dimethylallyltransferase
VNATSPVDLPPVGVIVGPTASGKTALALAVARRLPVEVISADSRQVYRGMDIGTAKPTAAERAVVAHHLIDLVAPDEPFSVAQWVAGARRLIPEIAARGRLPLVVGGTGLYVSALVDGFDFDSQPWSPATRRSLSEELETAGLGVLADRLRRLAPETASATDLRNPRRVLRALERAEQGSTLAPRADPYAGRVTIIGLDVPREVLVARIGQRARDMFDGGLLEETRSLLEAGYSQDLPALSGHGYHEAAAVLTGAWDRARAVEVTALRTRQYAKRQMTWFRRDGRVSWLALSDRQAADAVELVVERLR